MGLLCCKTQGGSLCCALFSLSGVTFMLYIKTLLSLQPRYMHGITLEIHNATKSGNEIALSNTTSVALIYTFLMVISTVSFFYHKRQNANARFGTSGRSELELEELDLNRPLMNTSPTRSVSGSLDHADYHAPPHDNNRSSNASDAAAGTGDAAGGAELTLPDEQGARMAELVRRNVDTSATQPVDTSAVGGGSPPPAGAGGSSGGVPNGAASPAETHNLLDLS